MYPCMHPQPVLVVSGLPRSGTSMAMQMIHAGGVEALTDQERQADADNPRGYFEYERVKALRNDKTWLDEAQGKVVKIIHAAERATGHKGRLVADRGSREPKSTGTHSPVAKPKRNRYGV